MIRVRLAVLIAAGLLILQTQGVSASTVQADTLVVTSLPSLLDAVRQANPSLQAASLEADALWERPAQVGALPDPTFGVGIQPVPVVTARGSQRSQWQAQQAIPYPGKLALRREDAEWTARMAEANIGTLEHDLTTRAKYAYFDLVMILRKEALVRGFQRSLLDHEEIARTRYNVGTGMQQAILKAQLERNALLNRLLELEKARKHALETLSALVNAPLVLPDSLPLAPDSIAIGIAPDHLMAVARESRPELAMLKAAEERASTRVRLAQKEWKPDFGVGITYFDIADGDVPPSADGRNALAIGVSVRVPIQRGRLRARLEENRIAGLRVKAQQEALLTSFRTDIADLVYRIDRQHEQLTLFSEALIPQANTTLSATLSAYATGRTGFLDLLDAERMLFDLQWSFEGTLNEMQRSAASLERALGIDRLSDLAPRTP